MTPNAPKTPIRYFRADDDLWRTAQAKAAEQGTTLSDVIRTLLRDWVEEKVSFPTKDGAWVTATQVVKIECDKCGVVTVSKYPCNDRELMDLVNEHVRKHGGRKI